MKFLIAFQITFLSITSITFAQSFQWARSAGDIGRDAGRAVCVDKDGNVIVAGYFAGKIKFDVTYTGRGLNDMFIAKFNPDGDLLWVKTAGGPLSDIAYGVAADNEGNIFVTGEFDSLAFFDSRVVFSAGKSDIFIAKYSSSGQLIWVERAGGQQSDAANAIAVDKDGGVYITGRFESFASFGTTVINSSGFYDVFFAKYDNDGNLAWVKKAGGVKEDVGLGIAVDTFNNCYATGYFNETVNFQVATLSTPSVSSEIFIIKIDSVGEYEWANQAGGLRGDAAYAIAVDDDRNSYITGYFADRAYFGQHTLDIVAYNDIFVAKYSAKGVCLWAKSAGGRLLDIGTGIDVANDGSVYVTGVIDSVVIFENDTVFQSRKDDTFIAKWNKNGDYQWVRTAGGPNSQIGLAVCVGNNKSVYFTGYYYSTLDFGDTVLLQQQDADIFLAKLHDPVLSVNEKSIYRGNVLLFPNPATGIVNVLFKDFIDEEINITVIDLSGKVINETKAFYFTEDSLQLDFNNLPEGVFLVKIYSHNYHSVQRMVIVR